MELITTKTFEIAEAELMAEQIKDYMSKAKSKSTRKAYQSDWKDFDQWCASKRLISLPAMPATVAAYLIDRAKSLKIASLERRLVSIRQAHAILGYPFDKNDLCISDTFKGIRKTHGMAQTRKTPIVIEDLRAMVLQLGDGLQGKRDRALLLLGFTGAFRRSELVSLLIEDMNFKREGIEVLLRKSKTDQEGKGETVPIPYGSNPETCPVRSIQEWIEASGNKSGFLFRGINKHGHVSAKGMSPASVAFIIKRNDYVKDRELQFSGHSLRAGFCTQAAINGIAPHASMRQARQKKFETHQKYVRIANMWQECAATKLGL